MSDFNLSERFPDLRPITRLPSLMNWNGIGTTLYGRSGYDDETGTYVTTHWFCFLFIPIVALGAFRVANAPGGGWYFLGRVPLGRGLRLWNLVLLLGVLAGGGAFGWHSYTSTPNYKAGREVARADRLVEEGKGGEAAGIYRTVMLGTTEHAAAARKKLQGLVEAPPESLDEAARVFEVALDLHRQNITLAPDLFERGKALASEHADSKPRGALALLESVAPLASKVEDLLALRRRLLERLVKDNPRDAELASRLAVVYESLGDRDRCEALLSPHAIRLGNLEGAAILGRLFARQGKYQQAFDLLNPFVEGRLPRLHSAERDYAAALKTAQQKVFEQLEARQAPGFDYPRYQAANEAEKRTLVGNYIDAQVRDDPSISGALRALREQTSVVPAALDLGIVRLQRAQSLPDPAARRAELENAEKTFLSIRGVAGGTDAYRLFLGQVYYWLGKTAEGRKLFDELIQAKNRSVDILTSIGGVLREVGAVSEGRALVEEAYNKETNQAKKYAAAGLRSVMWTDLDDQITWLGRADPNNPEVKASLATARGHQARRDNQDDEAARYYRDAIATYAKMTESTATLNNSALAHQALYSITHDQAEFTRAVDKLDRAIALAPSDSILLLNAASTVMQSAAQDVIGKAIDLKTLKRSAGLDLLDHLYTDTAGKEKLVARLRKHPGVIKGQGYYERLMVLSPRRPSAYSALVWLYALTRDARGMRGVRDRLARVELDLDDYRRQTKDYYERKKDDRKLADWKRAQTRADEVLSAARKVGGVTFAVAAVSTLQIRLGRAVHQPVNADDCVKLAEEALQAARSEATRSALVNALTFRAHQRLTKANARYAALARRTERSLGSYLLAYILGEDTQLRKAALADPDVKRLLAVKLRQLKDVPEERGISTWAHLVGAYPEEADRFAEVVRKDVVNADRRAIDAILTPLSGSAALNAYWALKVAGKERKAAEELKRWAKRGVPLPVEAK
jgi:tetratricopeptide (TPR) repeat protein